VLDHSTLSRRAETLEVARPRSNAGAEPLHRSCQVAGPGPAKAAGPVCLCDPTPTAASVFRARSSRMWCGFTIASA
jgi:hypothetical protein